MSSLLNEIKDTICQIIETNKSVIDFDFSVVDDNFKRIIGTGEFKVFEGLTIPETTMTAHVIKTGEHVVMHEPRSHRFCEGCEISGICREESTIIYPIMRRNRILGAISILAFDPEKKEELKRREASLFSYLMNLADLLYSKALEYEENRRMYTIFDTVNDGIILADHNGNIVLKNIKADELYNITFNGYTDIKEVFPQYDIHHIFKVASEKDRERNTSFIYNNKKYHLTIKKVNSIPQSDILFLITDMESSRAYTDSDLNSYSDNMSDLNHIVGISDGINECKEITLNASKCDSNVLIQGESGTGKELFAKALHDLSIRKQGPFVAINCSAIPENLIESELFGYESGAFTGAQKGGKVGKFELANNGTLFLDEIGDMPLHLQSKILRAIEYGQIEKVGSTDAIRLNIRVVAATNKPLEEMINEKSFRSDLFYRLNVIQLNLPALKDRREDILVFARHFIRKFNREFSKTITGLSGEVEQILFLYDWPGNIRELENTIEYAVHMESTEKLNKQSLPKNILSGIVGVKTTMDHSNLKLYEKSSIHDLLELFGNTVEGKEKVAETLGISLSTLYRRIRSMK